MSSIGRIVKVDHIINSNTFIHPRSYTEFNIGRSDSLRGTFFGFPLLFDYRNCEQIYNSSNMKYSFYFASQTSPSPTALNIETISSGNSAQVQHLESLGKSYFSFFEMAPNDARYCSEMCSLTYSCENRVFGASLLFQGNPSLSAVAFFAGLSFNQSLAMYPVCKDSMKCASTPRTQYHYYILFGAPYRRTNLTYLGGFTIQMHQETEIILKLSGEAHALNNTVIQPFDKHVIRADQDNTYTTLWVEPKVSSCETETHSRSLEGTEIISSKPISLFTNRANCDIEFTYDSQVIHQIPEVRQWGKAFIIDTLQIQLLPESVRNKIEFEIAIRTAETSAVINTTYYPFNQQHYVNTRTLTKNSVYRIVHSVNSLPVSHVSIMASSPVLIIYSVRSLGGAPLHVHYSVLVQPIEWFSNKQTIVLQHPTFGEVYNYRISVVVAKEHYSPKDILIADSKDLCQSIPLTDYKGFTGNTNESQGHTYVIFYMEMRTTGGNDSEKQLLLWHRNPRVHLGVTVFSYANDLQYAYSNGYSLGELTVSLGL